MKGYYNDPEGTAEVLKDGWLFTGDLATVDEDGFIYVVGRSKNIIKSGGYRISPTEIQNEILSLEKFTGCVVFGEPDEIMGEAVVAVVQTPDSSDQQDLRREIIAFCNTRLPSYKVPKKIFFIDEFPLNASSKVDVAAFKKIVLSGHTNNNLTPAISRCTESRTCLLRRLIDSGSIPEYIAYPANFSGTMVRVPACRIGWECL